MRYLVPGYGLGFALGVFMGLWQGPLSAFLVFWIGGAVCSLLLSLADVMFPEQTSDEAYTASPRDQSAQRSTADRGTGQAPSTVLARKAL